GSYLFKWVTPVSRPCASSYRLVPCNMVFNSFRITENLKWTGQGLEALHFFNPRPQPSYMELPSMASTRSASFISWIRSIGIWKPPLGPLVDSRILFLANWCSTFAVKAMGEPTSWEISLRLTLRLRKDCKAMKVVALIPYSQAFENIFSPLLPQVKVLQLSFRTNLS